MIGAVARWWLTVVPLLLVTSCPTDSAPLTIPCQDFDAAIHALLGPKVPRAIALAAIRSEAAAGEICRTGGADAAAVLDAANRLWDVAATYRVVMK